LSNIAEIQKQLAAGLRLRSTEWYCFQKEAALKSTVFIAGDRAAKMNTGVEEAHIVGYPAPRYS